MDRRASAFPCRALLGLLAGIAALSPLPAQQQVCLPAPRLLTLTPLGGTRGTTVDVTLTGESLEDVSALLFSAPGLTAEPALQPDGTPVPNRFRVSIAADAPLGVHDARVRCRLGVSSARAFTVGDLPETTRATSSTTPDTAFDLAPDTVCNAAMTKRAVDHYRFPARAGQRFAVECAAAGIDSKLVPVLMVADAQGRDLLVNRTGGVLDFTAPADGTYLVKVHSLTFQGGPEHFYRLVLRTLAPDAPLPRHPRTRPVSAASWPPADLPPAAALSEREPDQRPAEAQRVTLPLDVSGTFFPAADVDVYEFEAHKGETWWVELASERLGHPTDPFVVVQHVTRNGTGETLTDIAELADLPSPVKVSTNGYSYDGPPYDVGSPDVLGKFDVPADGTYRLQVRDLFGGTRAAPTHAYRLVVRPAKPDFTLAAWAVHMTLRNGDRNALSKPASLRAGASMAFEVVALRRDGFDGPIDLRLEGLPPGVTAAGLRIPAGKAVGTVVLSAAPDAGPAVSVARLVGTAEIGGRTVTRPGAFASMQWPVRDAKQEIPKPRLLADWPVSVTDSEPAPVTIAAREDRVWTARSGETLTVPLRVEWREEFTGGSLRLKAYGAGFEALKETEIPVSATDASLTLDLAALKLPPGEHTLALYGPGVCRYRYNPAAVDAAEAERRRAEEAAAALAAAAKQLTDGAAAAPADLKPVMNESAKRLAERHKAAEAAMSEAAKKMKAVSDAAAPKETADIVVSHPIRISVSAP
jgi:hypothetical protein